MKKIFFVILLNLIYVTPVKAQETEVEICADAIVGFIEERIEEKKIDLEKQRMDFIQNGTTKKDSIFTGLDDFAAKMKLIEAEKKLLEVENTCGGNYNMTLVADYLWKIGVLRNPNIRYNY